VHVDEVHGDEVHGDERSPPSTSLNPHHDPLLMLNLCLNGFAVLNQDPMNPEHLRIRERWYPSPLSLSFSLALALSLSHACHINFTEYGCNESKWIDIV
jgi:hypothetical protein